MRRCALPYLLALLVCSSSMARAENLSGEPATALERLIRQALLNHPDIAAAQAERRATEFEVGAARNRFYPTPAVQLRNDKDGTTTVASLTQPLWAAGRLTAGMNIASRRAQSAAAAIDEARYNLALRVVAAWAAFRQAQGRQNARADEVELLKIYAESVSRRIQGGASAEVDRELVVARLTQAQSEWVAARAAQHTARAQLARLLGQAPRAEDLEPAQAVSDVTGDSLPPIDEFILQATDYSPTLRRIDADIEASRHEVEQKQAALWPAMNLRAERQRSDATATATTASDSRIMLILDYAPDAGLSTSANIDAARTRIVTQQEKREAARRDLADNIQRDYEEYFASHERVQSIRRTLEASTAVLASYDRLLIAGKRSWLDVLNIARELTLARASLADIDALMVASRYRLRLHAGELPGISSGKSS